MQYGFIKVAAAVPTVKVADCQYNLKKIESLIAQAEGQGVEIITFPELCLTGYTCQDLFRQELLLQASETAIFQLLDFTRKLRVISIIGLPLAVGDLLLNCAVVILAGQVMGVVPKTYLPNYSEFYEKRWFSSAQDLRAAEVRVAGNKIPISSDPLIFCTSDGVKFGIEICEDVWAPTPPSNHLALAGADIIFNLSASNELIGKRHYLMSLLKQQSARTITGYVYASAGFGESTQDLVYGGHAFIYENGSLLAEGQRFAMEDQLITTQIDVERLRGDRRANTTYTNAQRSMIGTNIRLVDMHSACQRDFVLERDVDPQPFIPKDSNMQASCQEIIDIQSMGLVKRLVHTSCKRVIIGISGGLDSTLALLVCVRAFDKLQLPRKGIIGVTMPGFGTTDRTHNNAVDLMNSLGVTSYEISIAKSVMQHFEDIGHDPNIHDITYENSQARERTQILMDLSNKFGGMVIGTGDLSELALGWATTMATTCRCMVLMQACQRLSSSISYSLLPTSSTKLLPRRSTTSSTLQPVLNSSLPTKMEKLSRRQKTSWVHTNSTTSSSTISFAMVSDQRKFASLPTRLSRVSLPTRLSSIGLRYSVAASLLSSSSVAVCLTDQRLVAVALALVAIGACLLMQQALCGYKI